MKKRLYLFSLLLLGSTFSHAVIYNGNFAHHTWTLNTQTGVLEISGTGDMDWDDGEGYYYEYDVSWYPYRSFITSAIINSGVTSIGQYAFSNCENLKHVEIPTGVTSIGDQAFRGCKSLSYIAIPNGITSIGVEAFIGCSILSYATIGGSVTHIGAYAFGSQLQELYIDATTPPTCYYAFYYANNDMVVHVPESSVTAYQGASGWSSFSIVAQEPEVSGSCGTNLTWTLRNRTLTISGSGSMTDWSGNHDYNGVPWYDYRSSILSVVINNGATNIGNHAFDFFENLRSIKIPNTVTSIGNHVFDYCQELPAIIIPGSVTSIGERAFTHCTGPTSIYVPNSVTSIGSAAFFAVCNVNYSGTATGSPWNAKNINKYSYGWFVYESASATQLLACSSVPRSVIIVNSVTNIGNDAFRLCKKLTSVTIPNSVTSIGDNAFNGCSSLTSVTIPNSVTSIGEAAFDGCRSLTSLIISNRITIIEQGAFGGCSSLTSITIGEKVTTIKEYAFYGCNKLTSLTIPNSVTDVKDEAFGNCYNVSDVYCYADPEALTWTGTIEFKSSNATLFHVFDATAWSTAFPSANVTFVGDLTLNFANNANNTTLFEEYNGRAINATLKDRTLYQDDSWNTLCLPFDIADFSGTPLEDATVKELDTEVGSYAHQTGLEGSTLYLNFKDATSITAGKPYIVKWASGSNIVEPTFSGVTISSTTPSTVSSDDGKVSFIGTYNPVALAKDDETNLFVGEDNKLHWPNVANYKINTCRAYFHINESGASAPERIVLNYYGENNATNLKYIGEDAVEKFIRDGQIYIRRNGITYNALGTIIR